MKNKLGLGKQPFKIIFPKDSFGKDDVIVGMKCRVINEPKPYKKIVKSKFKFVNWIRKKLDCEKIESGYIYDVKMEK